MLIFKGQHTAGGDSVCHPAPEKAISQPIKLYDGAEAGWIRAYPAPSGMLMHVKERAREKEPCIMPAPNPCYSRAACDRVKENPPEQTVCQLGYVSLCITHSGMHTAVHSHCTPVEI